MSFARVRALAVVGALVVAAAIFVTFALIKDRQSGPSVASGCDDGAVVANIKLPEPQDVKINVYAAANKSTATANDVKNDFKNRKFQVDKSGADPQKKNVEGVAVLRYGPKMVGSAWLLKAYFLAEANDEFDIKRTDDTVDVIIGAKFKQLATITEVNQALARLGNPRLPPGTCSA
jgi:hypothetical protein